MSDFLGHTGKFFIIVGLIIAGVGVLLLLLKQTGIPMGKLPGDIMIQRKNFTFYFPLATSIILSIVLSLILYFLSRK